MCRAMPAGIAHKRRQKHEIWWFGVSGFSRAWPGCPWWLRPLRSAAQGTDYKFLDPLIDVKEMLS